MKILLLLFLLLHFCNSTYLLNNDSIIEYSDIPTNGIFTKGYSYPPVGFACSITNNNHIYFVSSSYQYNYHSSDKNRICSLSKKYVEIMKFDSNNLFKDNLIIGDKTDTYPIAVGGKGNDNIVT